MSNITIDGLTKEEWLRKQNGEVVEEKEDNVNKYINVRRLREDVKVTYNEKFKEPVIEQSNYLGDYRVRYYTKRRMIGVYDKKRLSFLRPNTDKNNGFRYYNLKKGRKNVYTILGEALLRKEKGDSRVRLKDEEDKSKHEDLSNIEWFMAEGVGRNEEVNLKEELSMLKGLKLLQVEDYIFIENGRVLSTKTNSYLSISSTRKNYGVSLKRGVKYPTPEAVIHIALNYGRNSWKDLTTKEQDKVMSSREWDGVKEYTDKFSEEVIEDYGRVSLYDQQKKKESKKRRALVKEARENEVKVNKPAQDLYKEMAKRMKVVLVDNNLYLLLEDGRILSVRTGEELYRANEEDVAYMIYIKDKQRMVYQRSVRNYMTTLESRVIKEEDLEELVGKKSKYYGEKKKPKRVNAKEGRAKAMYGDITKKAKAVVVEGFNYILVENGQIFSVRTGGEVNIVGLKEPVYMIYVNGKQRKVHPQTVTNFVRDYQSSVVKEEGLALLVGKESPYYKLDK